MLILLATCTNTNEPETTTCSAKWHIIRKQQLPTMQENRRKRNTVGTRFNKETWVLALFH